MLEITGDDIAALDDEDLRDLVGMLSESELRSHGLSTSAVTWGGNQNAADGGIDVRVAIKDAAPPGVFVPRASVGFQVKKTDFTPGLICPEMRPSGRLRPSICDLADEHGAYIIVSSGSDTSDSALRERLTAMRTALADKTNHDCLLVDFYDRNRLATWTRNHPGLIAWVRQKIGRGIMGWQPYCSWAASPDGAKDEYLLDDKARLHIGITDAEGIEVTKGIDRIRNVLRERRGVVRLAGLSGVGKTRLVQSLFDERVGDSPLDQAAVIYTDMSDNPSPQPTGMISDLVASRTRAIVVVDNCAPDLHRRITDVCRGPNSLISAITVEYDVQEDEPEGTEVFRLEPSSMELVSRLIKRRFPTMIQLDIDIIAEFAGGNARVALALASTLERHESVAGLQDEELFKRLFHQRQLHDDSLLKAAQACSLLFSFQGEALNGDDAELPKIATLIGISPEQLFAKVAQLRQRGLVQRRSVWRAILPHAIANRLAKMALREIPLAQIERVFDTERLMRSFSRRLGYMHESREAQCIAEKWLAGDGLLADINRLNDYGHALFGNIAPVSPVSTLIAIERAISGSTSAEVVSGYPRFKMGTILRSIAYDRALFERCVAAMITLALDEEMDKSQSDRNALKDLFHICWSGTHATVEQRSRVAKDLLYSDEPNKCSLGLELVEALLQTDHAPSGQTFEFGARVRDYGYFPQSAVERAHWFATVILMTRNAAARCCKFSTDIRVLIARSIHDIWFFGTEVQEQIEAFAGDIAPHDYWHEGFIAVRFALRHLPDDGCPIAIERLRGLESYLRPKTILEQVRAVVLSSRAFDIADADEECDSGYNSLMQAHERAEANAEQLGKVVALEGAIFETILPELVVENPARLYSFGRGLAIGSTDCRYIWNQLTNAVAGTELDKRNLNVLTGFLNGLTTVDDQLCETLLVEAHTHETLAPMFATLQSAVVISRAGVDRLKRAATSGKALVDTFKFLGWMNAENALSGNDLRTIVLSLAQQDGGFRVAAEIISMRFRSDDTQKRTYSPDVVDAGRTLLANPTFAPRDSSYDYHLHTIADVCLCGADGAGVSLSLCARIKQEIASRNFRSYNFRQFLHTIFRRQPHNALDAFFGQASEDVGDRLYSISSGILNRREHPINAVPIPELLLWCDNNPADRYSLISRAVSYHSATSDGVEWTPIALEMLRRAPDPIEVLKAFVDNFFSKELVGIPCGNC